MCVLTSPIDFRQPPLLLSCMQVVDAPIGVTQQDADACFFFIFSRFPNALFTTVEALFLLPFNMRGWGRRTSGRRVFAVVLVRGVG